MKEEKKKISGIVEFEKQSITVVLDKVAGARWNNGTVFVYMVGCKDPVFFIGADSEEQKNEIYDTLFNR